MASIENELDRTEVDVAQPDDVDEEEGRTGVYSEVARAEAALERSRERVERSVSALRNAIARRTDWRASASSLRRALTSIRKIRLRCSCDTT